MEKQKIILIEDKKYKNYFSAIIEINDTVFHTDIVRKLEQWEKDFEVIQILRK